MKSFKEITQLEFHEFYDKNYNKLWNYLFMIRKGLIREDIEEVINNSFMKLFKVINNYDETKASINTYLYTIAENEYKLYLKVKYKSKEISYDDVTWFDVADDSDEYDISYDQEIEAVKTKLCEYDDIFNLYFSGLSYVQIAKEYNITVSAAKNRIHYEKRKIGRQLGYDCIFIKKRIGRKAYNNMMYYRKRNKELYGKNNVYEKNKKV